MSSVSFSGLASGIDGDAIIQATIDARRLTKVPLENRIAQNNAEASSLDKLREMVRTLESKLRQFATFSGGAISKSISSSNDNVISAAVSGLAVPGTISMTVQQMATSGRLTFDQGYPSSDSLIASSLAESATMNIKLGSGDSEETFQFEINSETTLSSLALSISEKMQGKASASLVNTGTQESPNFRLMISALDTGIERSSIAIELDSNLENEGILNSYQLLQAQDAIVNIQGIGVIQRGRNTINDLIPGVSFEIKEASSIPISLRVSNDSDKTAGRVKEFVEAYNEIIRFVRDENKITRVEDERGTRNEYGSLARTRVDTQLVNSLRGAISGTSLEQIGGVRMFADLGITTDRNSGELLFDEKVFEKAMNTNSGEVSTLLQKFGDTVASSDGIINSFVTFNGLFDQVRNSKRNMNDSITQRLEQIESGIERQREFLKKMFARLEETIGKLNSNAGAITGMISQTSGKKN